MSKATWRDKTSTRSKENPQIASSWLHDCTNNHWQCRPTFEDEDYLQIRLNHVEGLGSAVLRLVSTVRLRALYARLRHRWGRIKVYILTSELLPNYKMEISTSEVAVLEELLFFFSVLTRICTLLDLLDHWLKLMTREWTMSRSGYLLLPLLLPPFGLYTCAPPQASSIVYEFSTTKAGKRAAKVKARESQAFLFQSCSNT